MEHRCCGGLSFRLSRFMVPIRKSRGNGFMGCEVFDGRFIWCMVLVGGPEKPLTLPLVIIIIRGLSRTGIDSA